MKNYDTRPYFDDFDENKKFYRILFRPGIPVQARELTQLQSILQNQIRRHGDHIFKEGAMVIPGQLSIDTTISYVKLQPTVQDVTTLIGSTVRGETTGVTAKIIFASVAGLDSQSGTILESPTLFVKYTNSGTDSETKTFSAGENLLVGSITVKAATTTPVGLASIAIVERGVYYVNGNFVLCDQQTIILEKYSNTPSYRIGLSVTEKTITSDDDDSLLDNAQGSYNYAAPGAHRYYIDLVLSKKTLISQEDENFIELVQVENGIIKRHTKTTAYSEIEKTLARRTYDESGNYTVRPFTADIREHRNNDRGNWDFSTQYLIGDVVVHENNTYVARRNGTSGNTPPTHTFGVVFDGPGQTGVQWEYNENPYYNRGIFKPEDGGDESKLAIGLEPGKAYVEGYEIEKIAVEYVDVNKARDNVQVDNAIIPATIGNYILIDSVYGLPPVDSFGMISLYDQRIPTRDYGATPIFPSIPPIGTARVSFIEWHNENIGVIGTIYKLGLFDIKLNTNKDFNRDVKAVVFETSFAANTNPILNPMIGSVIVSGTNVTGTGTSFQTDLRVGDYIIFNDQIRQVTGPTDDGKILKYQTSLTINESATGSGVSISYITTTIHEPNNLSLVFPFPYYAIKTVRSSEGTNDTSYTVYQRFFITSVSGNSFAISASSGTFASGAATDNYIVSINGSVVNPASILPSGNSVTINLNESYNEAAAVVVAAVNKSGTALTEKTKTLVLNSVVEKNEAKDATLTEILLNKADCYRLVSVKMKSGTFNAPGTSYSIDITDRYEFDSGQRDTHYDVGRIRLKTSYTQPTAPIQIVFDYFEHSAGDYFTVNSYGNYATETSNTTGVAYSAIPSYLGMPLANCIDFRPRISNSGTAFSGEGSSTTLMPKRGNDIRADFKYYLSRKTKIAIDFNGNFFAIDGVSSLNPGEPPQPATGMVLYDLTLEPYTFGTSSTSVQVTQHDNKRYTMRDIGKLEKRIDNLEYYTSLSLLEQQTESLNIIDEDGLDRFKNGFIVDAFSGHNTGDVNSPDYLCSIDMEQGILMPFFSMDNVSLVEKATSDTERANSYYRLYGDVITLPVSEELPLVKQEFASRIENINPFAVFTFLGSVVITPSSDDWFEVNRRPDIINEVEGNFNTLRVISERTGVLGTIWNGWQTLWAGAPFVSGRLQTIYDYNRPQGQWVRQLQFETTAIQLGQVRSGVRTSLVPKIDRQVISDRVLSSAAIPYMRSRFILVQVKGLKPDTIFYPYFDNVDISSYCMPTSKLTYIPQVGAFDDSTNVGGASVEAARHFSRVYLHYGTSESHSCLTRGDVITGSKSQATAIVVGKEYNSDTNTYSLFVLNVKGTFEQTDIITGSISNATGAFTSIMLSSVDSPLISNFNGELQLLFRIPNNDSIRFRTGTREFKLVDSTTADGAFTSRARGNYRASGLLETRQTTVNSVRNGEFVQEPVQENRVIVQTSERLVNDTGWFDPLAQTFMVQSEGGAFLTKVDIFFATKDTKIPVSLEIREVVNGYPGKIVLPFSRVTLKPEEVNLSDTTVDFDGVAIRKYDTATSFVFPSPVYVQNNQEYAVVLYSDSNNYKVWISQLGDMIPDSTRTISEQPYMGVLFKSQNASTWTADQMQDLKFTIWRAKFDTTAIGNVALVNNSLPFQDLELHPIETRSGKSEIRVYHQNHGMPDRSRVTISDYVKDMASTTDKIHGIPVTEIYKTHTISYVDADSYCITVTTAPDATGYTGGSTMRATRNIQYDTFHPLIQLQSFPETSVSFKMKAASGKSPQSGSQSAYTMPSSFSEILVNENNMAFRPLMVASDINEAASLGGAKSLQINAILQTTNDALTPVIDTQRLSLIAINNKINNPSLEMYNVPGLDENILISNSSDLTVTPENSTLSTSNNDLKAILKTVTVGKYLTINNSKLLVAKVESDGSAITFATKPSALTGNLTVTQHEIYVDEIAPSGSTSTSKYVTKQINLTNASNYIRVRFAANIPVESNVEVYYRATSVGSTATLSSLNWNRITPDKPIQYAQLGSTTFTDLLFSTGNLPSFNSIQVKLVMKSTNTSAVPRIKDLRVIACA